MGKSKNKKLKQSPETVHASSPDDLDAAPPSPVIAIDGHNTQGWTDSEIKAYNELIVERQKLEKQRHELEEKCAKSQTQRALLHENVANIDSLFKQQKSMTPAFQFTGSGHCCVEVDATGKCHHEICKRAKQEGVSDLELDTIKYYAMRIHTEKSQRICNALRKQRDLELIRIKREEDEGLAQSTRKSSKKSKPTYSEISKSSARGSRGKDIGKAAKETEKIVNKIINQLDDLRSDLQTGRISAEEAQGKLNILDSKLPVIQDKANSRSSLDESLAAMSSQDVKATTESFQSHLRERLLNAKGDTFSQAFSIMDHFLSATKPDELQEAIAELKDVLQLSGPMCDELQNSLGALEGIFDNPDKLSFTGPDGKQECNSIIDLMEKLKDTLKRTGQLPDGANASLTKVFQECIDLEAEAKEQLTHKCTDDSISSADLPAALAKIKEENVAKSPIPPLTSNKLDSDVANLLDIYDARQLLSTACSGVRQTALEAQITSLVITRTQKKSAKYLEKLERLDIACRRVGGQEGSSMLRDAIANVLEKMKKFVPMSDIKKGKQPITLTKTNGTSSQNSESGEAGKITSTATGTANTSMPKVTAPTQQSAPAKKISTTKEMYKTIAEAIERQGKFGLVNAFQVYTGRGPFESDNAILDKAQSYAEKTRTMIEDQAFGVQATISCLYKLKLCPGLVAVLVSQALLEIAVTSEDDFRCHIKDFSNCVHGLASTVAPEWSVIFQHIALAMVQLYVASYVELMVTFPKMSALFLAMSVTDMLMKYTLTTRDSPKAHQNLTVLTDYLRICFSTDTPQNIPSVFSALGHYRFFCIDDRYRCLTVGPCSKHMHFARIPFKHQPAPSQILRKQHTGQRRSLHSSDKPTDLVPVQTDVTTTEELEGPVETHRIRPMKTVVLYPPDHPKHPNNRKDQVEQEREHVPRKRDIRYQEALKQAAVLCDQVARRAHALNTLQIDGLSTRKSPPPAELLAAIADIMSADEVDLDAASDDKQVMEPDVVRAHSRFSEHLDEPQRSSHVAMTGVSNVQKIFKQIRNGNLGVKYSNSVVDSMKECALSGQYPNPIDVITEYENALIKAGKIPHLLDRAILKGKDNLQTILGDTTQKIAFETRRLKYLLSMVEAEEPSVSALFKLVSTAPPAFHEYHEIVSAKLKETDISTVEMLEKARSDVTQLAKAVKLREYSSPLVKFAQCAIEDWCQRPREVTNYVLDDEDISYLSDGEEDLSELVEQGLAMLKDEPSLIAKSPARRPVLGRQSPVASAVASQASISSPGQSQKAESADKNSAVSFKDVQSSATSTSSAAVPRATNSNDVTGEFDEHLMDKDLKHTDILPEQDEDLPPTNSNGPAVSAPNNNDLERPVPRQPRDSSPEEEDDSEGEAATKEDSATTAVTYKQPSENMRNMFKYMKRLQDNARNMFQTAEFFGGYNQDHGKAVHGVAETLAKQVASYTEFVGQMAEWNGVEMPKDLEEFLDESKGEPNKE